MNVLDSQTGLCFTGSWSCLCCGITIMTYELGFVFAVHFKKDPCVPHTGLHAALLSHTSCFSSCLFKTQLYFDWPTSRSLLRGTAQWPVLPALH